VKNATNRRKENITKRTEELKKKSKERVENAK